MSMHDRLKKARIAAGYAEATAAARAFGWNENTYRSNENGARPFGREATIRYSRAFKVNLEWLATGRGQMKGPRRGLQVIGYVGAGAAVFPIDSGAIEEIEPPFDVPEGAFSMRVRGDSMYPAYRDGGYVVARLVNNPADALYARVIATLSDGSRYVKELLPGSSPNVFTLVSFAPGHPPMTDVTLVEVARVLGYVEP